MTVGTRVQHRTQCWYATVVARPHNASNGITEKEPLVQDGAYMVTFWTTADLRELGTVESEAYTLGPS